MSDVFKKYYLEELKSLWMAGKLKNHYEFKSLLDFNGAKSVIKYFGNYTHRNAIRNRRIIDIDNDTVTCMAKDYAKGSKYEPITVSETAFIRRFLMHMLDQTLWFAFM